MYIYDISKSIIETPPYEGDPATHTSFVKSIEEGDLYNLSEFSMCSHTATHVDAPFHYYEEGATVDKIRLAVFYGKCTVISVDEVLTGEKMEQLLPYCRKRILVRGGGILSSAAEIIAHSNIVLVGTDCESVAVSFEEDKTHRILALNNIAVLENLNLEDISDGNDYTLCAFPLRLDGLEAAPCRAILMEQEKGF